MRIKLLIVITALCCVMFTGCGNQSEIIGTWVAESHGIIIFTEDNYFFWCGKDYEHSYDICKYTFDDDKLLYITQYGSPAESKDTLNGRDMYFYIDGKLYMFDVGKTFEYNKISDDIDFDDQAYNYYLYARDNYSDDL